MAQIALRSLFHGDMSQLANSTTDRIISAIETERDDSAVAAIRESTEELSRMRLGMVLTDLIEDVPAS